VAAATPNAAIPPNVQKVSQTARKELDEQRTLRLDPYLLGVRLHLDGITGRGELFVDRGHQYLLSAGAIAGAADCHYGSNFRLSQSD
jgi:hypothetical protein